MSEKKRNEIPPGWSERKLGSVLHVGSGKDYKHLGIGDIPVFGTGGLMLSVNQYIHEGETVFIGRKGTIDKPFYYKGKFWTVDTLFYTYDYKETSARYVNYVFQKINWVAHNEASGVPSLSKATIENIRFPLPPLPEQNRIVAVLETWDQAIQKLAQIIEKKKNTKKGLMQELLTGKRRLRGFSKKWRNYVFGDVAAPRKGRFDPRQSLEMRFCIELEHIESGSGRLLGGGDARTSLSLKTIFYPDDILFGKLRAYLKKYWIATNSGVCSTEIWALKVDKTKAVPSVLYNIVQSSKFISIASMSQGTHMPRSNWEIVRDFEVQLPSIEEQIAIGHLLTTADQEIQTLERKLSLLQTQKRYLLSNLITGTIRTPETLSIN